MKENIFRGVINRILQILAHYSPGADSIRVWLHRLRGVRIGRCVWIGYDCVLETSRPYQISIGDRVVINMRVIIIAHFHESKGVFIQDDVFIGPGAIILPNVTVGKGSVITAGSVVTRSVPPNTMVQGNPAIPIARCNIPLSLSTPLKDFYKGLEPLKTIKKTEKL